MALSSRSMLVSLNQRIWQAHAADRRLAADVEKTTEANNRTMRVLKQLAPTDYLLPIRRLATYGREQHERLTLAGFHKGQQLLATRLFDEYTEIQGAIKESFFEAVRSFGEVYPSIVEEAPKRLGKAFRPMDFPTQDRIKSYFDYSIRFAPVPDGGNWLLDTVDVDDVDNLRNQIENQKNEMFRDATKELFERATEVLDNIATQAKNYVEGQTNGAALRELTINSVKDMAVLLSQMNITSDPILDSVSAEMQAKFADLDAKEMRHDAVKRQSVADLAARLSQKLKGGVM